MLKDYSVFVITAFGITFSVIMFFGIWCWLEFKKNAKKLDKLEVKHSEKLKVKKNKRGKIIDKYQNAKW